MTDYHLGPLFRLIPSSSEPPGTGTPVLTWPRLFFDLAHPLPNWQSEDWGEYISDILTDVEIWEGGPNDTPEFTVPYVQAVYVAEAEGWVALDWIKKNMDVSLLLRHPDYPDVPDLPGTGNIDYVNHSVSGNLTIDLTATIPRRCNTFTLPAPQIYVAGPAPGEGNYIEEYRPTYIPDGLWYRSPTNRDFSGENGSELPQPNREFRRNYQHRRYTTPGFQEISGIQLDNYYLPNGTNTTVLENLIGADQGAFTLYATIDVDGTIYNTSKQYALNYVANNGINQPKTAVFWILEEPLQFSI